MQKPNRTVKVIALLLVVIVVLFVFNQLRKNRNNILSESYNSPPANIAVSIPSPYQALYADLDKSLDDYISYLDKQGKESYKPIFGAHLLAANSNRGKELLNPESLELVKKSLDQFEKMDLKGVTVTISYPILLSSSPNSKQYLEFYQQVFAQVKKRGLLSLVEANVAFDTRFKNLTLAKFKEETRQMHQLIISKLAPDYLSLGSEPDTFAKLTGLKPLYTSVGFTDYVNNSLNSLQKGNTKVGAGGATWIPIDINRAVVQNTKVDFIALHIYPLGKGTVASTEEIIKYARQNNKKVLMDEAWLYKAQKADLTADIASSKTVFKRDVFSFWSGLDSKFLSAMAKLAAQNNIEYVSPFWSNYFFAYIDYSAANDKLPYNRIMPMANQAAWASIQKGGFSLTGLFYQDLVSKYR